MKLDIDNEFTIICEQIKKENKNITEWRGLASEEMFLSPKYSGGFDKDTNEFNFHYYDRKKNQYNFKLSLEDVLKVANGVNLPISLSNTSRN